MIIAILARGASKRALGLAWALLATPALWAAAPINSGLASAPPVSMPRLMPTVTPASGPTPNQGVVVATESAEDLERGYLAEFERRLFPKPACYSDRSCVQAQSGAISYANGKIHLTLEIHAVAKSVYPLPSLGGGQWSSFGKDARFMRSAKGVDVLVEAGVTRLEFIVEPAGQELVLSFENSPKKMTIDAPGWSVDMPSHGAINTVRLGKNKSAEQARNDRDREQKNADATGAQFDAALFIDERRVARFDATGADVSTLFKRLSPSEKPASTTMKLMPGEKLISTGGVTTDGVFAKVDFGAGVSDVEVNTRWEYKTSMPLTAHVQPDRRETWIIEPWSKAPLKFEGLSPVSAQANSTSLVFMPKPGESLAMLPQQIIPAKGAQIAVDRSELVQTSGEDKTEHLWSFTARSTIATPLEFKVPAGWKIDSTTINNQTAGLSRKGDGYMIDLLPGTNMVAIKFGVDRDSWWWTPSPLVSVGAPVANLKWTLQVPQNQWVVWTMGPLMGPAVLIWGVLVAMCILAFALSRALRSSFSPSFLGWVGLLVPLSALSPWSALVLVIFIFALNAKDKNHHMIRPLDWNGIQLGLMILGFLSSGILLAGVYQGLLGTPDMMVRGAGSNASHLVWYLDKAPSREFSTHLSAGALLAPIWLWRAMMLGWALWVAATVAKRLPAMWAILCLGGFWRKNKAKA